MVMVAGVVRRDGRRPTPGAFRVWLGVSVDRVVLFAVVMALVDVAVWSLVAVDLLLSEGTRAVHRPPVPRPSGGGPPAALDGGRPGVLHQPPCPSTTAPSAA